MNEKTSQSTLEVITGSLCSIMGIEPPMHATSVSETMINYADRVFDGKKADRIFMYNPDAIGSWIYKKYAQLLSPAVQRTELQLPLTSMMPSVTPVCYATIYSGAHPTVHGIQKYEKPVLTIETIFDALIKAGKKPAIVASRNCSVGNIFLERNMDYFYGDIDEVNAIGAELIMKDEHDFIVVYNGNYDAAMHKYGPESIEALGQLTANARAYAMFDALIQNRWQSHNVFMGFAMDHGCHEIDGNAGSHGLDMPEDMNITHFYKAYCAG